MSACTSPTIQKRMLVECENQSINTIQTFLIVKSTLPSDKNAPTAYEITHFPDDILKLILSYLPAKQLLKVAPAVCKKWNDLAHCPSMWIPKFPIDLSNTTFLSDRKLLRETAWFFNLPYQDKQLGTVFMGIIARGDAEHNLSLPNFLGGDCGSIVVKEENQVGRNFIQGYVELKVTSSREKKHSRMKFENFIKGCTLPIHLVDVMTHRQMWFNNGPLGHMLSEQEQDATLRDERRLDWMNDGVLKNYPIARKSHYLKLITSHDHVNFDKLWRGVMYSTWGESVIHCVALYVQKKAVGLASLNDHARLSDFASWNSHPELRQWCRSMFRYLQAERNVPTLELVQNVTQSMNFYETIGIPYLRSRYDEKLSSYSMTFDDFSITLARPYDMHKSENKVRSIFFSTSEFSKIKMDEMANKIEACGGKIISSPKYFGSFYQCVFEDLNSNIWNISLKFTMEEYWKDLCIRNNHSWIFTHTIWKTVTKKFDTATTVYTKSAVFIPDSLCRGFILLDMVPKVDITTESNIFVYFAMVDKVHRRKGVLKSMLEKVRSRYAGFKLWLECKPSKTEIWRKCGFQLVNGRDRKSVV